MISSRRFLALFALALGLAAPTVRGDIVVNFNDLGYPGGSFDPGEGFPAGPAPGTGSYDNGWDLAGGFTSNGVIFSNSYDTSFHSWEGWGYSDVNDPTKVLGTGDADFNHQFAAITGTAPGGSGNYGIDFDGHTSNGGLVDGAPSSFIDLPSGTSPVSFEVTNTTYTYLSMRYGDAGGGKQFTTGDFLELQVFGYTGPDGAGSIVGGGPVNFFLANYTSPDSLPVDVWSVVDLTKLAGAQSLGFGFVSSDVGPFGYNTPLFFAMDDLTLGTSVPEPSSAMLALTGFGIAGFSAWRRRRRAVAAR